MNERIPKEEKSNDENIQIPADLSEENSPTAQESRKKIRKLIEEYLRRPPMV